MSDLLSLLSLGSAGIAAQNTGVSVATNNVANANTAGFSRQRVDLESLLAAGHANVGGVRSGSPDRLADNLLAGRIRSSAGALSMSRAFASAILDVEDRMTTGPSIHERLASLFGSFASVAAAPTDPARRSAVITAATDLVDGIRRRAAELEDARAQSNQRIRDRATEASELARRLADTNLAIARANDPVMRDERDRVATQLSQLVGGTARIDADGQMRFVLDGGAVLVDGTHATSLAATVDPVTRDVQLAVGTGATSRPLATAGGQLGAELAFRDTTLASARTDLDQLAFDTTSAFNAVHTANAGQDGVSGRPMFAPLAQVAGAATSIALDPSLAADPKLLATAAPGAGPGDNRGALALFDLGEATVASGGRTLTGSAIDLVSGIAQRAASARSDVTRAELVDEHLAGLRDSLAGVDIQEELANLARFEHASSAMTRFVSTIDGLLGDLIDRL